MNVNRWRNYALVFMFGGFFIMYCGVFNRVLLPYLLLVGTLLLIAGIMMYFRFGPVNPSVLRIPCPRCGKETRVTGEEDSCSHCGQRLRKNTSGHYEPIAVKPNA